MFELLRSPWNVCFDSLISQADHSLIICSPYIGKNPCEKIKNRASQWSEAFSFTILTDLSCDNLISGVTDIVSISSIVEKFPNTEVRFLPSLHAKIYLADDLKAVVTSANMTDSGLMRNFEYGVLFSDISTVQSIKEDVLSYASVGSAVDLFQLRKFTEITLELRDIRRLAEKNLKSKLNKEFKRRVEKAEEEFIRVRVGGQHLHTIF